MEDTPRFQEIDQAQHTARAPIREALRTNSKPIVTVIGFTLLWSVGYHSALFYIVAFATTEGGLPLNQVLIGNTIAFFVMLLLVPMFGALSDKVGRKPLLIAACVGFALCAFPAYALILQGSFLSFLFAQMIMVTFLAIFSGPGPAALVELFPTRIRASSLAVGYSLALVAFGGTTPLIQTFLVDVTGTPLASTLWVVVAALVTLVFVIRMKETAKEPLQ